MHRRPRLRQAVAGIAVLLGAAVLTAGCSGGKDAVDQNAGGQFRYVQSTPQGTVIPAAKRKKAGALTGALINGGSYRLSQDAGKVVVLAYFASWCGPCQVETPQLDALYRQRKSAGVAFVGIDTKEPTKSDGQSWVAEKDITFPVVFDQPAKTALQLGGVPIVTLPASIVIDRQGRVAAVYFGPTLPQDLTPVLDSLGKEAA